MDSITRISQKIIAERARNTTPSTAPPPYSEDADMESDDEQEPADEPVRLVINAAHSIHGSNNIVPTSPTPLADATKFSTLLIHAVNQINAATARNGATQQATRRRPLKVDLTINCGITIVGDRNAIGNIGIRPKAPGATPVPVPAPATAGTAVVAGAKRKSEDPESQDEPAVKKIASGDE